MKPLSPRQHELYDLLVAAAEAGSVCPTNEDLAWDMGWQSSSNPPKAIAAMESKGHLKVKRFNRARVVEIVELDIATAMPALSERESLTHWRERTA